MYVYMSCITAVGGALVEEAFLHTGFDAAYI